MICVLPVLLLLLMGGGLANPVRRESSSETTMQETMKEMQKSIQVLYSKIQAVENHLKNGEYDYMGLTEGVWEALGTRVCYHIERRMHMLRGGQMYARTAPFC